VTTSLADIPLGKQIKLLLIGDSGAGKTCGACSFAEAGKVRLCDFDGKASSARMFYRGRPEILKNIEVERYTPTAEDRLPARRFMQDLQKWRNDFASGKIQTLIIDSLTTFTDETLKWLMRENPGLKRPETRQFEVACINDYQILRGFMKQFVMEALSLPANVIFTAHIATEKDESTGEILRTPMIPGKFARELPIYFEEVWRVYMKDGKSLAQTVPNSRYTLVRRQLPVPNDFELKYSNITKALGA
jgi:hypothetical protein